MLRSGLRIVVTLLGALYCTCVQFQTPLSAQTPGCTSIDQFTERVVTPLGAKGIAITAMTDPFEVREYLKVVNATPPESDFQGTILFLFVLPDVTVIAIGWHTEICNRAIIGPDLHRSALLAAKRGA